MNLDLDFSRTPLREVTDVLLADRSAGRNILWAAEPPMGLAGAAARSPITEEQLLRLGSGLRLRAALLGAPGGGVPAWLCCRVNNELDARWFGRQRALHAKLAPDERGWEICPEPIRFSGNKHWPAYVDSRRLEARCGEASCLCSRYDAATGEPIPPQRRIGQLERKLRVVNENTNDEVEWLRWARRAFESVYGYEARGGRLLLARANLLLSYAEYRQRRWGRPASEEELRAIAEVISWNLWQMDARTQTVPNGEPGGEGGQTSMFALLGLREEARTPCRIRNWRQNRVETFGQQEEMRYPMRFDFTVDGERAEPE